jgi:uncharacterized protein (TIGR00730 family)
MSDKVEPEQHPNARLVMNDPDFLNSDRTKAARLLLDYQKTEDVLSSHKIRSTICVFGSARVRLKGPGHQRKWMMMARNFGAFVGERGGSRRRDEEGFLNNVLVTGGGEGIMAAANSGAKEVGAPSMGFGISLPHEERLNEYITPEYGFKFTYFSTRKLHFVQRAAAIVLFPGGFGTMDELFEILTLVQTHKTKPIPIVLVDKQFWEGTLNFGSLVASGLISKEDMYLFEIVDNSEEAWQALLGRGLKLPQHAIEHQAELAKTAAAQAEKERLEAKAKEEEETSEEEIMLKDAS